MRWIFALGISLFSCCSSFQKLNSQTFTLDRMLEIPGSMAGQFYEGKNNVLFNYYNSCTHIRLYKSRDEGKSWESITALNFSKDSKFDICADGTLLSGYNKEAYYSEDDGENWTPFSTTTWPVFNYLSGTSLDNLFILSGSTVYRSINRGASWIRVINNVNGSSIVFYQDPTTNNLYICSDNEIWQSKNMGQSWTSWHKDRFSGVELPRMFSGLNNRIYVAGHGYVWVFSNQGVLRTKTNVSINSQRMVHLCQTNSGRLIAYKFNANYYSDNEGASWKTFTNTSGFFIDKLFKSSFGVLFGTKQYQPAAYRSEDEGVNWDLANQGIQGAVVRDILHLSIDRFIVLQDNGIFYTGDVGQHYKLIHQLKNWIYGDAYSKIKSMCTLDDILFYADGNNIYKYNLTTDQKKLVYQNATGIFNGMTCNSSNKMLFFSNSNDIYRSTDLGDKWVKIPIPVANASIGQPIITDEILVINVDKSVYRSQDYGDHWFKTGNFPDPVSTLHCPYPSMVYFVHKDDTGNIDLFQSYDAGLSWFKSTVFSPVYVNEDKHIWINNKGDLILKGWEGDIYRSFDNGQSFSLYHDIGDSETYIFLGDDQRIYIQGNCFFYRLLEPSSDRKLAHGFLFKDDDQNCLLDATEIGYPGRQISIRDGNSSYFLYSNPTGAFYFEAPPAAFELEASNISPYHHACVQQLNGATLDLSKSIELGLQILKECHLLNLDLSIPGLRRCFESTIYIHYSNIGTDLAPNASIELILDPYLQYIRSNQTNVMVSGDTLKFQLGDVHLGSVGKIAITVFVSCNAKIGQELCVEASIQAKDGCITGSTAIVKTSANCNGDSTLLILTNLSAVPMKENRSWKLLETGNNKVQTIASGFFKLQANESRQYTVQSSDQEQMFSAQQEASYPYNKFSQTLIDNCLRNPGIKNAYDEEEPFYDRECMENTGSYDPNDIIGRPLGITTEKRIESEQELEYTIRFQNTGTDTAFNVIVVNDLKSSNLDLATLTLGASSHSYAMSLIDGHEMLFAFKDIMLPDSNINATESHGFLKYKIKPKKQLPPNSQINNQASIYFDFNEPVKTNTDFHTIGLPLVTNIKSETEYTNDLIEISPNPVLDFAKIKLYDPLFEIKSIELIDVFGRRLKAKWSRDSELIIDFRGVPAGVYMVAIEGRGGERFVGKVVKL
ncbi:MAG: T9SS type A sorting domain-containing protein [Saprospiraceae bacterium]|nr:T9SS type A sorting domain-containing protein [Saprospiraceae bacterium]